MLVKGKYYRTVWLKGSSVFFIDQNQLPFKFKISVSKDYRLTCLALKTMQVRGAGAIGATAAFALAQAYLAKVDLLKAKKEIEATRPTAQNLFTAVQRVYDARDPVKEAQKIAAEDAANCQKIGEIGQRLLRSGQRIGTHCNAGWLAFVDYGSALAPIYAAKRNRKKVFVYVDETRPRNQGAKLTAWELRNEKVPYVIIPDNAGAHLMRQGKIDLIIVGADRIAANGDVANKIGTLEKAVAAKEFGVPFYVAAPTSTFDLKLSSGEMIPLEERSAEEVLYQTGQTKEGVIASVLVSAPGAKAYNPAFDVTPAKYLTGIITEKGIIAPSPAAIKNLFH